MTDYESEYREIARLQSEEIEKLRAALKQRDAELDAVISWLAGDAGALETLQSIYIDPRASIQWKVRAASSALPFERSRPANVTVIADFRSRVHDARMQTVEARKAGWTQAEQPQLTSATILGGDHEGDALSPDPAA
jgi:hypothetical protein